MKLTHSYRPQGRLVELFESTDPEILISGSAGTGKSRACLEKVLFACLATPNVRALFVRKTLVSLGSTALVTWREHVAVESLQAGHLSFYGGSTAVAAQYRFTNGSSVTVGGLDNPTRIMSSEYDLIYVQEAIELSELDWESLVTRLRNGRLSYQQIIADTNPDVPTHWLKRRCDVGTTKMITSVHEDNPTLCEPDGVLTPRGASYISKLDSLTGVRLKRYRHGLWVAAEGQVYEGWDTATHVIEPFPIPDDWLRFWSVDFGYTNPFVCQMWAEDPDGRLYLYRELYRTQRLVEDHARDILDLVAPDGVWLEPEPTAVIADHDAEDRATFERHVGLSTVPAKKTVSDGIQAVQARLRRAGDGRARLFVFRDCLAHVRDDSLVDAKKPTCTTEEVVGYIWLQMARLDVAIKEVPRKVDDHGCDAMRYMVAERDLGGRPNVRWL